MNAYTTDPEQIRSALMESASDDIQVIGDSCAALAQIIVALTRQIEDLTKRLDALDEANKEAIEQAIAYAAYENGEDHL